jgi:fructose-bisphosphate aldolase class II
MALVTSLEIYRNAEEGDYAVGGYECYCPEILQAQVVAAEEEQAPFIMQIYPKSLKYFGLSYFIALAKAAAHNSRVPIAIHLDHGDTFEEVVNCIRNGFTSVMIDGSDLPLEENIALTKKVVKIAHAAGVTVEAEIGKIGGRTGRISPEEAKNYMTDPKEAQILLEETKIDTLAVAVGNASGLYQKTPNLDFDRLRKIRKLTGIPLVLHGGSGIPEDMIKKAIEFGVRKINVATLLKKVFTSGIREMIDTNSEEIDPRKILGTAQDKVCTAIKETFGMLGCVGKA